MKKIIALLLILSTVTFVFAQDAKTVFSNIPDSLSPTLTAINRADFVDFMESNMSAKVKNKFGGESEMTDLTDSYIRIKTTDKSTWEMKLLSVTNGSNIICVVTTACGPACDSSVKFYDTSWKELPAANYITLPTLKTFITLPSEDDVDEYNEVIAKADIFLDKAELNKDSNDIIFTCTTPDYMEKKDQEIIRKYLAPSARFEWNGEKYIMEYHM